MATQPTVLVTGVSRDFSRKVLECLLEGSALRIVAGTRIPDLATPLAERGVEVRHLDYDDRESLARAFEGVDRLLLVNPERFGSPFRVKSQLGDAVSAAERAGVHRVVYISAAHPDSGSPMLLAEAHLSAERALAVSRLDWTSLRLNFFTDCLWELVACQAWSGTLVAAAGEGGAAFLTRADAARAVAAAIASPETYRGTFEVTGPAVLTFSQVAAVVSEVTNLTMNCIHATQAAAREVLSYCSEFSPALVDLIISCQTAMQYGRYGPSTPVVRMLTGREPESIRDFILDRRRAWIDGRTARLRK